MSVNSFGTRILPLENQLELEINNREMARRRSSSPLRAASVSQAARSAQYDKASARLIEQYLGLKRNYAELRVTFEGTNKVRLAIFTALSTAGTFVLSEIFVIINIFAIVS